MKRLLLLGIILAICIFAMPQGVLAATQQQATVTSTVQTYLELRMDNPASQPWTLTSGDEVKPFYNDFYAEQSPNAYPIKLNVSSNNIWTVQANGTHLGHMYSTVVPHPLINAMNITTNDVGQPVNWIQLSDSLQTIRQSRLLTERGKTTFSRNLEQDVFSSDPVAADYSITITFVASSN